MMMSSYSGWLKTSSSPLSTCHGIRLRKGCGQVATYPGEQVELREREEASGLSSSGHLSPPLLPAVLLLSSGEGG